MLRLSVIIFLLWTSQFLFAQALICPPNRAQACHDNSVELPEIIDGAGLELITEKEFEGNSCEARTVTITYRLIDEAAGGEEKANCSQVISIRPFHEQTLFPRDTFITGKTISEVLNQSVYTDGMFPQGTNDCNIAFSYEDLLVEMYPNAFIYRYWSAKNACDNTIVLATQAIRLTGFPHNSIAPQVQDCGGVEILIDSIEILLNNEPIQLGSCFTPFDSLHQALNCLADSLLILEDDSLSIRLHNIDNPYLGISTIDVIDIQRHILGLKRFEKPCRLLAGDVNKDSRINGQDLVELRKLILGIYTEWPYGEGPELMVNGEQKERLSFAKGDFPLPKLDIIVTNQGNPSTN